MMVKNTVRFLIHERRRKEFDLKYFVEKILFEKAGVPQDEVFCIQDFQTSGIFDVTFYKDMYSKIFFPKVRGMLADPEFKDVEIKALFFDPEKVMTVHLFDPFSDIDLVIAFLLKYCESVNFVRQLKNEYGFYNGKSTLKVKLKFYPLGFGAVYHPPSSFNIAGCRGFLTYAGQPMCCKKCLEQGHIEKDCQNESVCRHCKQTGHAANTCPIEKSCDVCGLKGHMARVCPVYKKQKAGKPGEAKETRPEESGSESKKSGETVPGKDVKEKKVPVRKDLNQERKEEEGKSGKPQASGSGGGGEGACGDSRPAEEEVRMDTSEQRDTAGRRIRVVKESFFHDKCNFAKLRTMGFAKLRNTDTLVIPEGFIVPAEWTEFENYCTWVEIT